jgi:hypothetical protein
MRKLDMGFVCFDRYGVGSSLDELKSSNLYLGGQFEPVTINH